MWLIPPEWLQ
ncbi:hypothetical protein E2C01_096492 [Portunus trituberculatus]|uniref:Uncharacterized protein n=1 Tax=Portunus trituberculatus TaxID=210409 RepID=A0A5B7JSP9_PORTR|nr:hypothetical protein [Portunus trituberculatus]